MAASLRNNNNNTADHLKILTQSLGVCLVNVTYQSHLKVTKIKSKIEKNHKKVKEHQNPRDAAVNKPVSLRWNIVDF